MSTQEPHDVKNIPNPQDAMVHFAAIPSVHELVKSPSLDSWTAIAPHQWLVDAARHVLNDYRRQIARDSSAIKTFTRDELARRVATVLASQTKSKVGPLVNATGIILHTGLGRAPLARAATAAVAEAARQYASVEINLETGHRGQRIAAVRDLLCKLTGAESAVVVNNNAAATFVVLATLAGAQRDRPSGVIVSRGELIEIGDSFRLPQIMEASGAVLSEVGTTNRTNLNDYEQAITADTVGMLKVHTSNYRVTGFTESVSIQNLAELGRRHQLPVVHDIGSGAMFDFKRFGLEDEPTAVESLAAGADLVLFSGDKLLGGPQAGLILGTKRGITHIEKNPLMRAMRVDKLTLAGLEATLRLHHDPQRALREIPVLAMAAITADELRYRATKIVQQLHRCDETCDVQARPTTAYLGGGSLPGQGIDSLAIYVRSSAISETQLAAHLRANDPPVIPRVQDGAVWLDLRTVFAEQDAVLVSAVQDAFQYENKRSDSSTAAPNPGG